MVIMVTSISCYIMNNKTISVFQITGLKILGRVGTHTSLNYSFSGKNIILCILKGILPNA